MANEADDPQVDRKYLAALEEGTFWSALTKWRADNPGAVPDLSKSYLRNADLSGGDLSHTNLTDADLSGGVLVDTNLSDVDLRDASLVEANLTGADLANTFGSNAERQFLRRAFRWRKPRSREPCRSEFLEGRSEPGGSDRGEPHPGRFFRGEVPQRATDPCRSERRQPLRRGL
jgi:hypothetical protein